MDSSDTLLAQRFARELPGLDLIAIENAALPVTVVNCDSLGQERKRFPLLDEYLLRLTSAGIAEPDEIAATLGVDPPLIDASLVEQMSEGTVLYSGSHNRRQIALTELGRRAATELASVKPVQTPLRLTFDRMTWRLADYPRNALIKKREAKERELIILPPSRQSRIGPEDIELRVLNTLISANSSPDKRIEILAIRKVQPSSHSYLPVKLLIFADTTRDEIQLCVVVEDRLSRDHGLALQRLGGAEGLGIRVAEAAQRPKLDESLERIRVSREEVATILEREEVQSTTSDYSKVIESILAKFEVRSISVFEHPKVLQDALENSVRRLLIVAPWVKNIIIDRGFLYKLERRLERRVPVHVAYGIGGNDLGSDQDALDKLRRLAGKFPDLFTFARLFNSHAKILIYDDTWINTSFNWFSFRGDPSRTYRLEEGTLVRLPPVVDREYANYVRKIAEQSITAP